MDPLVALQEWFAAQCNGEWEHRYGVKIDTCDNPGWWVKVDLVDTPLQSKAFADLSDNVDSGGFPKGPRWLRCYVLNNVWNGAGDETKLPAILLHFVKWARS